MILRRVTEHVKAQNWFAVGLDFVIVVTGVFIGIQLANWNESRVERAIERTYLANLHQDFVLTDLLNQNRDLETSARQLIALHDPGADE